MARIGKRQRKEDKKTSVTYEERGEKGDACISSSQAGCGGLNNCHGADVCCSHIKQQLVYRNKLQGYWFTLHLLPTRLLLPSFGVCHGVCAYAEIMQYISVLCCVLQGCIFISACVLFLGVSCALCMCRFGNACVCECACAEYML